MAEVKEYSAACKAIQLETRNVFRTLEDVGRGVDMCARMAISCIRFKGKLPGQVYDSQFGARSRITRF